MVDGTMTATDTSFSIAGYGDNARIQVNTGGHLVATNSTFGWNNLGFSAGSVLNSDDLATGNTFNQTISLPITDIPLVANNAVFQNIDILPGNLASGTLELTNSIATSPSPNLLFVFTGAFEVKSGATLKMDDGVNVSLQDFNQSITVDLGGQLTVGAASVVQQEYQANGTQGIVVNGSMTATDTSFSIAGVGDNARIQVNSGGHLVATNSTFKWNNLGFSSGSVLKSGDLSGNTFNQTISLPATDIPLVANNAVFQNIDILPGNLASGTLELTNTIATSPSPNLLFVFTGAFEIESGATLKMDDGVNVSLQDFNQSITVDLGGQLIIGAASVVQQEYDSGGTQGIVVNGTMTATGTSFSIAGHGDNALIQVNSWPGRLSPPTARSRGITLASRQAACLIPATWPGTPSIRPSLCPSPTSR